MKNQFIIIIFFILAFCAVCTELQAQRRLVEISKEYVTKEIPITDGMTYKFNIGTQSDSARYFNPGADQFEAIITFKKKGSVVIPPTIEKVDGEKATFSANWSLHGPTTAAGWYGETSPTIAFSNVPGSSVSYTFTGTKIELWAERKSSHGIGKVQINSGPEVNVSFNTSPFGLPIKVYDSGILPNGTHTLKLTVVSGYALLDFFQVSKTQ